MRYNLETMLPLGAFEHCGNRHIKLYGGGGSWNPVEIIENTVSSVGDVVGDVAQGIGDAGSDINEFVKEEIPGGWTLPIVVAVAVTTGYVDPTLLAEVGAAEAAFTGATETGLATLAGEGAIADTIGATLLAGGEGAAAAGALEGAGAIGSGAAGSGAIPMELLPEMIPGGIPVDPGISLGQAQLAGGLPMELVPEMIPGNIPVDPGISLGEAQLAAGVTPMELVPEMIPEGIPVDPGISLAEGQINAGAIPSDLKEAASAINKARQVYNLGNALMGGSSPTARTRTAGYLPYEYGSGIEDLSGGLTGSSDLIKNLTPGLTAAKQDYTLSGMPDIDETVNPVRFEDGGAVDPYAIDKTIGKSTLTPSLTKAQLNYILTGLPGNLIGKAEGGSIQEHKPEFFSEGGLGSMKNRYVKGRGDGTSDSIPAMLANGEFVIPADVVSSLGNGSNDAGATILDEFLKTIRKHKRAADVKKLPPDSKGALGYLLEAKRKVKA
jgi:hypothetical protein